MLRKEPDVFIFNNIHTVYDNGYKIYYEFKDFISAVIASYCKFRRGMFYIIKKTGITLPETYVDIIKLLYKVLYISNVLITKSRLTIYNKTLTYLFIYVVDENRFGSCYRKKTCGN